MDSAPHPDIEQANGLIARAESLSEAVAAVKAELVSLRAQLAEKDRKIRTQQHEIQGLRDQLNLFKLAKRFQRTEPPDDLKDKIDTLLVTVEDALEALALELGTPIQPRS